MGGFSRAVLLRQMAERGRWLEYCGADHQYDMGESGFK